MGSTNIWGTQWSAIGVHTENERQTFQMDMKLGQYLTQYLEKSLGELHTNHYTNNAPQNQISLLNRLNTNDQAKSQPIALIFGMAS